MANKIFKSVLLMAAVVVLSSVGIIMGVLYGYFDGIQQHQLQDELILAAAATEQSGLAYLNDVKDDRFRLTWISKEGKVLFDSGAGGNPTGNHANREEIREAFAQGRGSSVRYSDTLMQKTVYEAKRLRDGSVLRIAASRASSAAIAWGMMWPILVVVAVAAVMSAVFARRIAKRIVQPLNQLNLEKPLENDAYEELTPLLQRLNQQHLQISSQVQTLRRRADEFVQTIANLKEGLILLDREDRVMNINPAACRILGTEPGCRGKNFLTIDTSAAMKNAVNQVFLEGYSQLRSQYQGREYQFDMSRIESEGKAIGTAILVFDVTEQANLERSRREFSANVSHELKTPLQSIIGSAELLENGLVKQEDVPHFVGKIRQEASRLVSLIQDIIRLSQLDENVEIPKESVELLPMAQEILAQLQPVAEQKQVRLHLEGGGCRVSGVSRMLYEILYNLCDNAIKYNVQGGSVTVTLRQEGEGGSLTVSDTGIGIPYEHQQRVFERFYRVDKSHSKQSEGTGLGLSIVKHAVQDQGGKIRLESTPGKGTAITVSFSNKRIRDPMDRGTP